MEEPTTTVIAQFAISTASTVGTCGSMVLFRIALLRTPAPLQIRNAQPQVRRTAANRPTTRFAGAE